MTKLAEKVGMALLAMQRHPWEQGFAAQAFYEAGRDKIWLPMARECAFRRNKDGRLALVSDGSGVCDPACSGEVCLRAWEKTHDVSFKAAADGMLAFIQMTAPRSEEGYVYHMLNRRQLWSDSGYMLPPFLYAMGNTEDAARQLEGYNRYLRDEKTGLYRHIYDFDAPDRCDSRLWATGNGWMLMALIRMRRPETEELLCNMLKFQRADGLFCDVMDDTSTFTDGTTALMTAYVIFRGVREGTLDKKYLEYAEAAYATCAQNIDDIGILHGVCGAPDFCRQGTSAEAQAAFILADSARERIQEA